MWVELFTIAVFVSVLEGSFVEGFGGREGACAVVEAIEEGALIIFCGCVNQEVSIFGSSIEDAGVFDIGIEIDLYSMSVFDSFDELSIIYFIAEVMDDSLM